MQKASNQYSTLIKEGGKIEELQQETCELVEWIVELNSGLETKWTNRAISARIIRFLLKSRLCTFPSKLDYFLLLYKIPSGLMTSAQHKMCCCVNCLVSHDYCRMLYWLSRDDLMTMTQTYLCSVYYKPPIAAIPPLFTCYHMLNLTLRG